MKIKKSQKVDVKKGKMIFLKMGLVIVLGVCLVGFKWTSEGVNKMQQEVEPIAYAVVDEKPVFSGGDAALMKFLAENTKYPEIAKEKGIEGKVFIQFVIDETGQVTKVQVLKGVNPYFDAEAKRVVTMLPSWAPGKHEGKFVPVIFVVPINFKLTFDKE